MPVRRGGAQDPRLSGNLVNQRRHHNGMLFAASQITNSSSSVTRKCIHNLHIHGSRSGSSLSDHPALRVRRMYTAIVDDTAARGLEISVWQRKLHRILHDEGCENPRSLNGRIQLLLGSLILTNSIPDFLLAASPLSPSAWHLQTEAAPQRIWQTRGRARATDG